MFLARKTIHHRCQKWWRTLLIFVVVVGGTSFADFRLVFSRKHVSPQRAVEFNSTVETSPKHQPFPPFPVPNAPPPPPREPGKLFFLQDVQPWKNDRVFDLSKSREPSMTSNLCQCNVKLDGMEEYCCEHLSHAPPVANRTGRAAYRQWEASKRGLHASAHRIGGGAYQHWAASKGLAPFVTIDRLYGPSNGCAGVGFTPSRHGDDNPPLMFRLINDNNVFHQLAFGGQLWCCHKLRQEGYKNEIIVGWENGDQPNPSQRWMAHMIHLACGPARLAEQRDANNDSIVPAQVQKNVGESSIFGYLEHRLQQPYYDIVARVRDQIHASVPKPTPVPKYVALVFRDMRVMVDHVTGLSQTIVDKHRRLGLPVKVYNLAAMLPEEQVKLMMEAAVFVAVHGAELTNMFIMHERSHVIEITLRYGWCCDGVRSLFPVLLRKYFFPCLRPMPCSLNACYVIPDHSSLTYFAPSILDICPRADSPGSPGCQRLSLHDV